MKWYLIKEISQNGAFNMALDSYLLENPPEYPLLRFYSWSPPAITIGYNQRSLYYNKEKCDQLGIDVIRRPTGGRAVYHNREITYSIIIPNNIYLFDFSINELHKAISTAIVTGLQQLGLPVRLREKRWNKKLTPKDINPCFESTSRFEISIENRKLVGSAQRRNRNAALQQGSILLKDEQSILFRLLTDSNLQLFETNKSPLEYHTLVDEKIYDKNQMIDYIIQGFEDNFNCEWISELNLSGFYQVEHDAKEQTYLYRTNYHEVSKIE